MTYQEKYKNFEFEKACQEEIDKYYRLNYGSVDRTRSCEQYDCIIRGTDKVEEKFRREIYKDILLEIVQDLKTNSPGWFYETKCNHLHYIFMNGTKLNVLYRFDWLRFKYWCFEYFKNNRRINSWISPKGWGVTLNLSVPINSIPSIYYSVIKGA